MNFKQDGHTAEINHKRRMEGYFSGEVDYWRRVYGQPAIPENETASWLIKRREIVLSLLGSHTEKPPLKVIDVGCGAGVYMNELIKLGHEVWGVDQSFTMVLEAGLSASGSTVRRGLCLVADVEDLPIKERTFDAAICVGVLQYLKKDQVAIRELSRVVKPGGIVLVTVPNILRLQVLLDPYYFFDGWFRLVLGLLRNKELNCQNDRNSHNFKSNRTFWNRRYLIGQLNQAFREAGLLKLATESVAFASPTIWRKKILPGHLSSKLSKKLTAWTKRPGSGWVRIFADRWVICLRRCK